MTQPEPSDRPREQPPAQPIRTGKVVSGAIAGFLASWLIIAFTIFAVYATYGDSSSRVAEVLAILGMIALPVIAALLLISPRTRHWGAGAMIGVALGSITGAGVCGGWLYLAG